MSVQSIIIRCDEIDCHLTANTTRPAEIGGWLRLAVPFGQDHVVLFDYCPDHLEKHR